MSTASSLAEAFPVDCSSREAADSVQVLPPEVACPDSDCGGPALSAALARRVSSAREAEEPAGERAPAWADETAPAAGGAVVAGTPSAACRSSGSIAS